MTLPAGIVAAANRLTSRWAAALDDRATVASGVCAWPLLALLADAAVGPARAELAAATGVDPGQARQSALDVLAALAATPGIGAALGLWTRDDLPLRPGWRAGLPPGTHDRLSGDPGADQPRLDGWASEHTGGLVPRMPVAVDPDTVLVLATALAVEARWRQRFADGFLRWTGPGELHGRLVRALRRDTPDLTRVYTAAGLTGLLVEGDAEIDVHVLLGAPDATAATVLAAGVGAATGTVPATDASRLPPGTPGPGLRIDEREAPMPGDVCEVEVPRFTVRGSHDLLALPGVFGLESVTGRDGGYLPGIGDVPLYVSQARQDAVATFSAEGFRAAAVTAMGMVAGAAMRLATHRVRIVRFTVDRPFGFVAVHRPTGLALVAGWVADPEPKPAGQ